MAVSALEIILIAALFTSISITAGSAHGLGINKNDRFSDGFRVSLVFLIIGALGVIGLTAALIVLL